MFFTGRNIPSLEGKLVTLLFVAKSAQGILIFSFMYKPHEVFAVIKSISKLINFHKTTYHKITLLRLKVKNVLGSMNNKLHYQISIRNKQLSQLPKNNVFVMNCMPYRFYAYTREYMCVI